MAEAMINVISTFVNNGRVTPMPATTPAQIAEELGLEMVDREIHVDSVEANLSTPLEGKSYISFQRDKVASGA